MCRANHHYHLDNFDDGSDHDNDNQCAYHDYKHYCTDYDFDVYDQHVDNVYYSSNNNFDLHHVNHCSYHEHDVHDGETNHHNEHQCPDHDDNCPNDNDDHLLPGLHDNNDGTVKHNVDDSSCFNNDDKHAWNTRSSCEHVDHSAHDQRVR